MGVAVTRLSENEFVIPRVREHFARLGFRELSKEEKQALPIADGGYLDLAFEHPETGERWAIEAKGETPKPEPGIDTQIVFGQLLQRWPGPDWRGAIALPNLSAYRDRAAKVRPWIVQRLGVRILWVSKDGEVTEG